ncbi:ABC transporter permease [Compostibacter hankyongensis]|uniref:ABC transporter permease n=1 Tax=Compostibacter hankyongensis TaxID=1007089 RepID=A0ABP8FC80_9BACT
MLRNYFKTALRQLWKSKLFTAVNLIGLSVGLASIMALLIGVYMYYTTDNMHKDKNRMYFLKTIDKTGEKGYTLTTYPLLGEILRTCPEVEAATHIQQWYSPWLKNGDKELQENTFFVDTGFFKVFSFPLKYGNPEIALKEKYSVVLSDKTARGLFGNINPVGKVIYADDTAQLTVTGVLEPIPANSTLRADVFLTTAFLKNDKDFSGAANWYNGFAVNFLKLKPGASIPLFNTKIDKLVKLNYDKSRNTDIVKAFPFAKFKDEGDAITKIIIKGSIATAGFILLIVLVNLINLNAAAMYTRVKEVAVRKIIGSSRKKIIIQFCIENGILVLISLMLAALLFLYVLLPLLNKVYGSRFPDMALNLREDYPFVLSIFAMGIVVAVAAGTLPVIRLISLPVADAVKGRLLKAGSSKYLRNVFITVQFALAVVFICITVILNRQIDYMKNASLGFDKDHTVTASLDLSFKDPKADSSYFSMVLNELKSNPDIKGISTSSVIPTAYDDNYNTYYDPATNKEVSMRHAGVDAGYITTFGISLVEGRNFNDDLAASEKSSLMINRKAMQALGWTSIEGKQLKQRGDNTTYKVVGVMENFNYQNMQSGIEPVLHWYTGKPGLFNNYLSLNIRGHKKAIMTKLEHYFRSMPSRRTFAYDYMDERVSNQYKLIDGVLKITNFVALLTIIVSCMGMFGLISLFAKQRVKEIGVRKALGATVSGIVMLLSKDFILFVGIACLIAFPVAWWAMNAWLQDFANHITIHLWMFAISGIIAVVIAALTVSIQALKAAVANPVKSLRTE